MVVFFPTDGMGVAKEVRDVGRCERPTSTRVSEKLVSFVRVRVLVEVDNFDRFLGLRSCNVWKPRGSYERRRDANTADRVPT
jgi:hypothetical protein